MEDGWRESSRRLVPGGVGRVSRARATAAQKIPSAPPCGGFERYAVALALEELDRAPRDALTVLPIAVIGTELSIDRVIREHMVRRP